MENVTSATNSSDQMLYTKLTGDNIGYVYQDIELPKGKTMNGLYFEAEIKMEGYKGNDMLADPVEMFLDVVLSDDSKELGEIWYANIQAHALEGSGLVGVPGTHQSTGTRAIIQLGDGYHRIKDNLYAKALDSLSGVNPEDVRKITLSCVMYTRSKYAKAEIYLDKVKLYYAK
ncbi:hypothetical protein U14_01931 [Candidatus Moduliflexus flocculans]|uniref:Uncharacterized protein n=1 Tax=Candidatus Moduliflexus flocculans TaxID=1499966 RepID=A0A0S6VT57_9BACT|nr:hypothetical protein U14_01931 [Candidatus Moduliflexus flocculans]